MFLGLFGWPNTSLHLDFFFFSHFLEVLRRRIFYLEIEKKRAECVGVGVREVGWVMLTSQAGEQTKTWWPSQRASHQHHQQQQLQWR